LSATAAMAACCSVEAGPAPAGGGGGRGGGGGAGGRRGGPGVPWWRVVNAAGRLPDHLTAEASRYWAEEGTPAVDGRCVMSRARADLLRLAADHETRLTEWGTGSRDLNSLAGQ